MRGSTTVGPLRDGESRDVGGVTYQLTQTVTSRAGSTYLNVLTINQALSDIEDSTFTCSVENTIGTSSDSQAITVNGKHLRAGKLILCGLVSTVQEVRQEIFARGKLSPISPLDSSYEN